MINLKLLLAVVLTLVLVSCNSNNVSYLNYNKLKKKLPTIDLSEVQKYSFINISDSIDFPFCDSTFRYQLEYSTGKILQITVLPPSGHCLEIVDRSTTSIFINDEGRFMIEYKEVADDELYHIVSKLAENFLAEDYYVIKSNQTDAAMNSLINILDLINLEFYKCYLKSIKGINSNDQLPYPVQPKVITIHLN